MRGYQNVFDAPALDQLVALFNNRAVSAQSFTKQKYELMIAQEIDGRHQEVFYFIN